MDNLHFTPAQMGAGSALAALVYSHRENMTVAETAEVVGHMLFLLLDSLPAGPQRDDTKRKLTTLRAKLVVPPTLVMAND